MAQNNRSASEEVADVVEMIACLKGLSLNAARKGQIRSLGFFSKCQHQRRSAHIASNCNIHLFSETRSVICLSERLIILFTSYSVLSWLVFELITA